jgi:hypothetical protein
MIAAAAARSAYLSSPTNSSPVSSHGNTNGSVSPSPPLTGPYTLSPLQQREAMQREAWEKERNSLLKKASNSQGDVMERLVRNYLAV